MKQIVTAIFAFAALTFTAGAQGRHGKHHRHQHHKAIKTIRLSETQQATAKQYREAMKTSMLALEKNNGITVKEYREKKAAIKKEYHNNMTGLLTPEQKNKMAAMKQLHQLKHQQKQELRMAKLKTRLNLTDAQTAGIKAGAATRRAEIKKIKQNTQMGAMEKKEQLHALAKQQRAAMMALLTPEQKQQFEAMKKQRHKRMVK